jgi:flagellar basal body L-ring protein FlgH
MKTLLKTLSLSILISAGLYSCKTASIMKRHYNKGYYVSKKHEATEIKNQEKTTYAKKINAHEQSNSLAEINSPKQVKDVVIKDEAITKKEAPKKSIAKENNSQPIANAFNGLKDPFNGVRTMPRELKNKLTKDDVARDALSLLWILILVLLIVYVIGLFMDLFGLGPIFHILGVIVLVLLILWLLRII